MRIIVDVFRLETQDRKRSLPSDCEKRYLVLRLLFDKVNPNNNGLVGL